MTQEEHDKLWQWLKEENRKKEHRRNISPAKLSFRRRRHAINRARERYQIDMDVDDLIDFREIIEHSDNITSFRVSGTRINGVWAVYREGRWYEVAYDRNTHQVCTFLTPTREYEGAYEKVG